MGRVDTGDMLYDIGAVADALQCPVRRLESWVEQQILEPVADASGPGTRRKFDVATAVKAGILNELRWLLGPHFRPGEVGRYLAALGQYSQEWRFLRDRPDRARSRLIVLYRNPRLKTLAAAFTDSKQEALERITRHGALVVINIDEVAARVRTALGLQGWLHKPYYSGLLGLRWVGVRSLVREYLSIEQLAAIGPWSEDAIEKMIRRGILRREIHYFQPFGPRTRLIFKWSTIVTLIEGGPSLVDTSGVARAAKGAVLDVETATAGLHRLLDR